MGRLCCHYKLPITHYRYIRNNVVLVYLSRYIPLHYFNYYLIASSIITCLQKCIFDFGKTVWLVIKG